MEVQGEYIKGEKGTGYAGPGDGPFRCSNCRHFNSTTDGCSSDPMKELSTRRRLKSGDVEVEAHGCCVYFDNK